ncbi:hypothetical protein HAX54_015105 [Datura stramonium]|uniref:Uncharacterized protein n=1 Tax=Datura stramonium TaxID=4076 RepID=A0ABS8TP31_DATST|nr:hypothetical protein [Datura stramonium]
MVVVDGNREGKRKREMRRLAFCGGLPAARREVVRGGRWRGEGGEDGDWFRRCNSSRCNCSSRSEAAAAAGLDAAVEAMAGEREEDGGAGEKRTKRRHCGSGGGSVRRWWAKRVWRLG